MAWDEKLCPRCGKQRGARGHCRNCGAICLYEIAGAFLGGLACVVLGVQTAHMGRYAYEPVLGGIVAFIGLWELGWAVGELIQARRIRKTQPPQVQ